MKNALRVVLVGAALPLAGCMTTGTNMHNDFQCRAPNGTCAPLSAIDAKAVAGLGASAQVTGGIVGPALPREGRVANASADGSPPGERRNGPCGSCSPHTSTRAGFTTTKRRRTR